MSSVSGLVTKRLRNDSASALVPHPTPSNNLNSGSPLVEPFTANSQAHGGSTSEARPGNQRARTRQEADAGVRLSRAGTAKTLPPSYDATWGRDREVRV